ncbi:MAG: ATP-dependent Clp protease ATP-binding subunit ClpC [Candidatus Anoxychlamydiales bacterium]|nr:ATP-dependent Clp protease ATP-binding subunit ClpC [Candidatus Anoxychlamydiales bacterium]
MTFLLKPLFDTFSDIYHGTIGIDWVNKVTSSLRGVNQSNEDAIGLNLIDATIRENILRILNISDKEANDQDKVDEKYTFLISKLEDKKGNLSPLLGDLIQQLIDNANIAYTTLKKTHTEVTMKPVSQNIYNTPLEIYEATLKVFPKAKADIERNGIGFKMNLKVSNSMPVLSLDKAVDAQEFLEQMKKLFQRAQVDKFSSEITAHEAVDIKRFSLMEPLSDWQKFRRIMFEKNGGDCQDEIMKYLNGSDNLVALSHLGLAPLQVEVNMTEYDLLYFTNILDKIKGMTGEEKKLIFSNFQKVYPNIYKIFFDETVKKQHQKEIKEKGSFFQDTVDKLREEVFGQDLATEALASLLTTQKGDYVDNKVFIFAGPTGVGKTALAKAASGIKDDRFINFPMNQYQRDMDIGNFFGSAPGLIGSEDKPPLAQEIDIYRSKKRKDASMICYDVKDVVILFDEFEKAHETVKQSLLTIFGEGYWTIDYTLQKEREPGAPRSPGKNIKIKYIFESCIFINTSNLYQDEILEAFLRKMKTEEISQMFVKLNSSKRLPTSLSKELLGRTSVIPFGPIPKGECYQKLVQDKMSKFLEILKTKISCKEIEVENEALILLSIERKLYGQGIDIRRVNRYFDNIREAISRTKSEWGDMQTKKLTFSHDGVNFFIKVSVFLEDFEIYHHLDVPLLILP